MTISTRTTVTPAKPRAQAGWDQVTSDAEASEDQLALAQEKITAMVDCIEETLEGSRWLLGADQCGAGDLDSLA